MKQVTFLNVVVLVSVMALLSTQVSAAEEDITGDWLVSTSFGAPGGGVPGGQGAPGGPGGGAGGSPMRMDSILMISKDAAGKLSGKLVSFRGYDELENLKFDSGKLTFTQVSNFGGNEMVSEFTGTIKDGKLTGTMSSDRGDRPMEGTKMPAVPAVVGNWEITQTRGDREITSTLVVSSDAAGKLSAIWKTERGENALENVKYESGKLTCLRRMEGNDGQMRETTYSLTASGDTISGTVTSQRGESEITGKRTGGVIIGKWELTISSNRGDTKQLLIVNPDMSGRFGSTAVDKITAEDGNVSFKITMGFGDRTFENEFKGKLEGTTLTGEMTGGGMFGGFRRRGADGEAAAPAEPPPAQKVTGKKI